MFDKSLTLLRCPPAFHSYSTAPVAASMRCAMYYSFFCSKHGGQFGSEAGPQLKGTVVNDVDRVSYVGMNIGFWIKRVQEIASSISCEYGSTVNRSNFKTSVSLNVYTDKTMLFSAGTGRPCSLRMKEHMTGPCSDLLKDVRYTKNKLSNI